MQAHMRQRNAAGFTLVEVIVALTILTVGIVAIMQLFPASMSQSRVAAERTVVASLAKTELGKVRAGGVGQQLQSWIAENALKTLTTAQQAYALYEGWRASVQRIGGDVDLYRVTFSVRMFDGRDEEFVTYITQN
ncbi:MAG TPA: prepilin-type N-terminal cleavage/methylation domain-containing protein [Candidatus Hydrogenedentes bacterium]|nr:prepilin-type N-terminal cleavage/methylation domain-containing protein [Candidatus Hydrogenedentota bacterium]HNT86268.1 prepilin-type N-terminal cleavage/methylation domain-containing protein [Candidatus Hydrogenedentota bacterium]